MLLSPKVDKACTIGRIMLLSVASLLSDEKKRHNKEQTYNSTAKANSLAL